MRTITGQSILCVSILFLFTFSGSKRLSLEKDSAPREGIEAARLGDGTGQRQAVRDWKAGSMIASWYGKKFQGRRTSSGDRFDRYKLTAAHRTLPLGSLVLLVEPRTGRSVVVRINDRGPWIKGRDLDLSEAAATKLGIHKRGIAAVAAVLVR